MKNWNFLIYYEHCRIFTIIKIRFYFTVAESWNRYPIGILAGNKYHLGIYDECVDVHYPIRGQYCLSEVKIIPSSGNNYSFPRQENLDDFGNDHAWHTILGVN